jgi:hypothetical protein
MKYSKVLIIFLLMVCWAVALAGPDKRDRKPAGPQIERIAAADPNVSISVCVASGDVTVHGWDRKQVRARSSDTPEIELRRSGARDSELAKEIVVLTSDYERRQPASCLANVDIELDVPRGASVKVQTRDGDIHVTDVATVQAKTMNGEINLEGIKRATEADTIGGDVSFRNSTGSAKLHSVGGSIAVSGVGPGVSGDTLETATVGGEITIDKSDYVKVGAGSIGGNLNISGPLAHSARYEFNTISGDIHLFLPADSSFRLDVKFSRNAELVTDFPLKLTNGTYPSTASPPKPRPPHSKISMGPDPDDLARAIGYGLQHISGVYGTGDAMFTISSFTGAVYLQKK